MTQNTLSTLIIDKNASLINNFQKEACAKIIPITFARSGFEAKKAINDINSSYVGIFINTKVSSPGSITLATMAHKRNPLIPIYFFTDSGTNISEMNLHRLAIQDVITPIE